MVERYLVPVVLVGFFAAGCSGDGGAAPPNGTAGAGATGGAGASGGGGGAAGGQAGGTGSGGTGATSEPAPSLPDALDCGSPGSAGVMPEGNALQAVFVDTGTFPSARCNDGSPAVFYFRPGTTDEGRKRWVIQLQGGGGCRTPDDCARRWCSVGTYMGMAKMTSSIAPTPGTSGEGILARSPNLQNPFADWNQVHLLYCSSDSWAGATAALDLEAKHPVTGQPVRFRIGFQGREILDAVIATLRRDGAQVPAFSLDGTNAALPDLDEASQVVFAGASAGAGGVAHNADRLRARLLANNPGLADFRAIIDSTLGPDPDRLDYSTASLCAKEGLCTWQDIVGAATSLYPTHGDESCTSWHAAHDAAGSWKCNISDHSIRHHITSPMFIRMGLIDQLLSGNAIDLGASIPNVGPMNLSNFELTTRAQLLELADLAGSEEGSEMTPPALFAPRCPKHETLSHDASVFGVTVQSNGVSYHMFDVFQAFAAGGPPLRIVHQPGDPVDCN